MHIATQPDVFHLSKPSYIDAPPANQYGIRVCDNIKHKPDTPREIAAEIWERYTASRDRKERKRLKEEYNALAATINKGLSKPMVLFIK